ncbi:MAG: cupin domain-containing protein [Anaerolineae bacterium]
MTSPLQMPGATLMTRLSVYDTPTPDGQIGGTPHVHLVCTEMYVVLSGHGAVEIIDKDGFRRVELQQHDALVFSPGTIHRLINPNRNLEILVIMQNSGLPERGDNVVTFKHEWLSDDDRYSEAMQVQTLADAYQRRNRGVEGFIELKAQFASNHEEGIAALNRFYTGANARIAQRLTRWQELVEQGALATAKQSLQQLAQLQQNDTHYLMHNQVAHISNEDEPIPGFCGHLNRYFDPATLHLEGQQLA